MTEAVLICDDRMHRCRCGLEPGHDGPHECVDGDPQCGGSWADHEDPTKAWVHRYPGVRPGGVNEGRFQDPAEPVEEDRQEWDGVFRAPRGGIKFLPAPSLTMFSMGTRFAEGDLYDRLMGRENDTPGS